MPIQENVSLLPFNTFHIDASARFFAQFSSGEELAGLMEEARRLNIQQKMILGGGSNILLTHDFPGLMLQNRIRGISMVGEDEHHIYIRAGAGEAWHGLVMYCVERNYGGVENLSLIPGNVGASPMQNIGAYGVEIKDVFHELEAWHLEEGKAYTFKKEECEFGYRESVFKGKYRNQFAILNVTYRLDKKRQVNTSYGAISAELESMGIKEPGIKNISDAVIRIRSSKLPDPKEVGNAGSFFKNPIISNKQLEELKGRYPTLVSFAAGDGTSKLAAGWLIEQCGWKGFRRGDAGCYPKQALVLVNYGKAKGEEVFNLSEEIIASVKDKFGVTLEREVNVV